MVKKEKRVGEWKELMVNELTKKIKSDNGFYISGYSGLKASEIDQLRRLLEPLSSKYFIVKNSMAKFAFENAGFNDLTGFIENDTAIVTITDDGISTAKALKKFGKEHVMLKVRAGYLGGEIFDTGKINYLAALPSREELVAKVVYGFKAPISAFAGIFGNLLRSLIYTVQAIKDKKGG